MLKEKISSSKKIPVFITFLEGIEEEKEQEGLYNDLDYLAGTWTEEDDREFMQVTEDRTAKSNQWTIPGTLWTIPKTRRTIRGTL